MGDRNQLLPKSAVENVDAVRVVMQLGDRAIRVVLGLVDIERLFVRQLDLMEIIKMCCVFPLVRAWFIEHHPVIRDLADVLNVTTLFGKIPRADFVTPLLEAFSPREFIVHFEMGVKGQFDILTALNPVKLYDVIELSFWRSDVRVMRGHFRAKKLLVIQNRWSPALDAVRSVFSSLERVDTIIMRHGVLDLIMTTHLERLAFTRLELHDVGFSPLDVSSIVSWLASQVLLTELVIVDLPFWTVATPGVRFFRMLMAHVAGLRLLRRFEFSVGGGFIPLGGLTRLPCLEELRINVEIHLSRSLVKHLFAVLRLLPVKIIQIGLYCCGDWSCMEKRRAHDWFIARLREENLPIDILYLDGLDDLNVN